MPTVLHNSPICRRTPTEATRMVAGLRVSRTVVALVALIVGPLALLMWHRWGPDQQIAWDLLMLLAGVVAPWLYLISDMLRRRRVESLLRRRVQIESVLGRIARHFMDLSSEQCDQAVQWALGELVGAMHVDRGFVGLLAPETLQTQQVIEWCRSGIEPRADYFKGFPMRAMPWGLAQLEQCGIVQIDNVAALPPEAAAERALLGKTGSPSVVVAPLMNRQKLVGWLAFDAAREPHAWSDEDLTLVRTISGMFAIAFQRKEAEERLRHEAFYDPLTRLPNRNMLADRIQQAIVRSKRSAEYRFAVLFLDFDRFKVINDSLGHVAGDQLLVGVAERLRSCMRALDTVARPTGGDSIARLGGDEFTILLDGLRRAEDATAVADRIHKVLVQPFSVGGHEVYITASIGIAYSKDSYDRPEEILRDADLAMYRAKSMGKARHEVFDREMHDRAVARLRLENDLRRAIERREFELHYQPIVELHSGRIAGFEALIRWRHPQSGLISPGDFIPIAEETGLIVPIGQWVLERACEQLCQWQDAMPSDPPLYVSVNLSRKQLLERDLASQVRKVLTANRPAPHTLKLEITESMVVENADAAIRILSQLRAMEVDLLMDDFGTGYSSLSCLRRFPLDGLKIDRDFVAQLGPRVQFPAIVQAIITLAHNLGMGVVAEGIENGDQLAQLQSLDCDQAQGFYFSKPVPADQATALLEAAARAAANGRPIWPVEHVVAPAV